MNLIVLFHPQNLSISLIAKYTEYKYKLWLNRLQTKIPGISHGTKFHHDTKRKYGTNNDVTR